MVFALFLALLLAPLRPAVALAQGDDGALRLMAEPASYTDVVDALDDPDPFDINLSLGFERMLTTGTVQREVNSAVSADGRASQNFVDIAEHERLISRLMVGADVGLYHDLAAYFRLPVVLSDTRELRAPDGRSAALANQDLVHRTPVTQPDGTVVMEDIGLFQVPFRSPTRSGLDYLGFGVAWGLLNQNRDPEFPTWVAMVEGRFNLADPRQPCQESCDNAGLSDGTNALRIETRASYRHRYFEPYTGLAFHIAWPTTAGDQSFIPSGDLSGFMNTIPPRVAELTAGVAVIPWEHRGRWQRFAIDLQVNAQYVSEGHGYSPLFDALGSSQSPYLTEPNLEGVPAPGVNPREVTFSGLTDMQSHGRYGVKLGLEMQAAQYVRFAFGTRIAYSTPYLISYADACNPNVDPQGADDVRRGSCRQGIINPHHRAAIDLPGNRFRVDGEVDLDFYGEATAQF